MPRVFELDTNDPLYVTPRNSVQEETPEAAVEILKEKLTYACNEETKTEIIAEIKLRRRVTAIKKKPSFCCFSCK